MAEHPDIALVRRGYQAFTSGDVATLSEVIAGDATQFQPGTGQMAGRHQGRQAILEFYGRLASESNGTFKVELDRVYTDGEGKVVATHRVTGEREGRSLDGWACLIFTIVAGEAQDIHGCMDDIEAWDDFWA